MDWDLSSYFSTCDGPEILSFKDDLERDLVGLQKKASNLSGLAAENIEDWENIILLYENIGGRLSHLSSYISCLTAANSNNSMYEAEASYLSLLEARKAKIQAELQQGFKYTSDDVFRAFTKRKSLKDIKYKLSRIREQSRYKMTTEQEYLASDLGVDGIQAWGQLYERISGKLTFEMSYPNGHLDHISMSQRRALMEHPNRQVRRAAFHGGNKAWAGIETVASAALNSIAGVRLTLHKHRGGQHYLDEALFQAGISQQTLNAMFEAVFSEIDTARRILKLKAKLMGLNKLNWFDLTAPVKVIVDEKINWEKAKYLVCRAFASSYPSLAEYAQKVFEKNWVDWSPRPNKRPGGFCTGSPLVNESRIYMTFNNNMGDVLTLAHELGHAFHSHLMGTQRILSRSYPMTLAESASTFGEMLLIRGLMKESDLQSEFKNFFFDIETRQIATYLLDIPVRFEFEKLFHEERMKGEVSVEGIKNLMIETQQRIFGPILDPEGLDPYFWASKLHFYITDTMFYNFPYTFGYLLSRGLMAQYDKEGPDFLPKYEEYLKQTGSDTVENVVRLNTGLDLTQPEFWAGTIRSMGTVLQRLKSSLAES
tara:strand:+ start:17641 stop:19428 length:1788 start_codon:yes stop_codon:yes gene_type:complete